MSYMLPPFKIKSIEPIKLIPKSQRIKRLKAAGYNPFLLQSDDIYMDLLTDSGTGAMSQNQWAGLMLGDETYAGSRNFQNLKKSIKDIFGYRYVVPAHQGRGAEHVLDAVLVKQGMLVPGNMHFDTTKAHIEHRKGIAVDCTINELYKTKSKHLFKGNLDIKKLKKLIKESLDKIAYVLITITCNTGGGQPVSLENIKEVSKLCRHHKILLFIDSARFAENSYFIKTREKKYKNWSIPKIVKEIYCYADGCIMSAKKDAIVNSGGFIATNNKRLYSRLIPYCILFEGFPTYGGMAKRDIEALARGLYEGIEEEYLAYRINQVKYLGEQLFKAGIPIVTPIGGHAVFVDAKKFLPHIPQSEFPAQALCNALYIESGIRAVEIGTILAGRNPLTGKNVMPKLDLMRLTIPRRVYTQEHMDYIVNSLKNLKKHKRKIKGLKFKFESPVLRHFQSTFVPVR